MVGFRGTRGVCQGLLAVGWRGGQEVGAEVEWQQRCTAPTVFVWLLRAAETSACAV